MSTNVETIVKQYISSVDAIYGVFLDSCQGFSTAKSNFERSQWTTLERNRELQKNDPPGSAISRNLTLESFDASCLVYSAGKEEEVGHRILHYCPTQAEYKERNSPRGENYKFIGNMALISIYEYWENSCRNTLASHHNVKPKQIVSQIFGDLRLLRHSIIHHRGIALPEIEQCKKFRWYERDNSIFIDGDKMEEIVAAIKSPRDGLYYIEVT